MNKIITGYWNGEPIWRDETSYDKIMRMLCKEESRSLDMMAGEVEINKKSVIDPDEYYDNNNE